MARALERWGSWSGHVSTDGSTVRARKGTQMSMPSPLLQTLPRQRSATPERVSWTRARAALVPCRRSLGRVAGVAARHDEQSRCL